MSRGTVSTRLPFPSYLDHLAAESARFLAVLRDLPGDRAVPTCPGWDADDLLFHLAEVQWFWARVVGRRITDGKVAEALTAARPADRAGLQGFFVTGTRALQEALRGTPPGVAAWSWSPDQTTGFSYRRQAHEALIHRVDAEVAAGWRTGLDPALAADGVDEALGLMYGGPPEWSTFTPVDDHVVRLASTDTGHVWLVSVGRIAGTDPSNGEHVDTWCLDWVDASGANSGGFTAEVTGTAADLDCWLWRRPALGEVVTTGREDTLAAFAETIGGGIR